MELSQAFSPVAVAIATAATAARARGGSSRAQAHRFAIHAYERIQPPRVGRSQRVRQQLEAQGGARLPARFGRRIRFPTARVVRVVGGVEVGGLELLLALVLAQFALFLFRGCDKVQPLLQDGAPHAKRPGMERGRRGNEERGSRSRWVALVTPTAFVFIFVQVSFRPAVARSSSSLRSSWVRPQGSARQEMREQH